MIHIATVHHKNPFWVGIQRDYLDSYIKEEYKLYAYLDFKPQVDDKYIEKNFPGIDKSVSSKFDVVFSGDTKGSGGAFQHSQRLKTLYTNILQSAKDEDIIVFLDSDAFPLSEDIEKFIKEKLEKYSLVAVQRLENTGDRHPHPMFCVSTIKTWKKLHRLSGGNVWSLGPSGGGGGGIMEIGGGLLQTLNKNKIKWYKMKRSNVTNYHKVFFGVYENLIYHHGGGSRALRCRQDFQTYGGPQKYDISSTYQKVKDKHKELLEEMVPNKNFYKQFLT